MVSSKNMTPLINSLSLGVVTINSRYKRRYSSVLGIPAFSKRLLQVGILSSIARRPLFSATIVLAVSVSSLELILRYLLNFNYYLTMLYLSHRNTGKAISLVKTFHHFPILQLPQDGAWTV